MKISNIKKILIMLFALISLPINSHPILQTIITAGASVFGLCYVTDKIHDYKKASIQNYALSITLGAIGSITLGAIGCSIVALAINDIVNNKKNNKSLGESKIENPDDDIKK